MEIKELSREIRALAVREGFDRVGFARAGEVEVTGLLLEWLGRGYHADMSWMARNPDVRSDPRRWYPDARSVISLALNYYPGNPPAESPAGKISKYALGADYHEIMKSKLQELLDQCKMLDSSLDGRIACDSSPVMDKYWAVQAGIGWQGKHSNVLSRDLGSWFFLGEIVINKDLEWNTPALDFCGTCTACIDACPTLAIVEPYVVDARKCISYWTIESKAEKMPDEIAENLEGWIFGCDICQDVCPWNQKFSVPTKVEEFHADPELGETDWEAIPESEFRVKFRHSPIRRAKKSGMERNARTAQKGTSRP